MARFFVLEPAVFDYIDRDDTVSSARPASPRRKRKRVLVIALQYPPSTSAGTIFARNLVRKIAGSAMSCARSRLRLL